MKKISLSIIVVLILALMSLNEVASAGTIPTISIVGVTQDSKVTIQTHNYPANRVFDVRMAERSTRGIGGILVGTFNSGAGGSNRYTFDIPQELSSLDQIAIRLDSQTGGFYSFNWFFNTTAGSHADSIPVETENDIPVIMVITVKKDAHVTIEGSRLPADETFDVLMGEYSTQAVDGVRVDTITPDEDGRFLERFDIPASLKSEGRIAIRVESTDSDQAAHTWFMNETGATGGAGIPAPYTGIPTISIVTVEKDETVTVRTHNFPANRDFRVLMGKMSTRGIGGIHVTTIDSGSGGSFTETFEIPEALAGDYQIAIRLESTTGGFFAFNWFYNDTAARPVTWYTGIPTFSITEVVKDETVTITTNNFPPSYDFRVLMGKMSTRGIDGIHVTTISSGSGGSFTETFEIPETLAGDYQIAIRLESTTGGFFAFNWFYNDTAARPITWYTGIPTFSITGVVEDESVTITTNNFPPSYDFRVLMGKMSTRGIGGIHVTTISSDSGGTFTETFEIPEGLAGHHRIAIRLESTTGGFFAFNWFFNNTYP